jgi:hypothetical protein
LGEQALLLGTLQFNGAVHCIGATMRLLLRVLTLTDQLEPVACGVTGAVEGDGSNLRDNATRRVLKTGKARVQRIDALGAGAGPDN